MSMQNIRDFLVLYGSQTGQAEAISQEIFDRANKIGFKCLRFCLSETEKKFSIDKESCVVFVCSTTGEGEIPDNASKFFRRLKKKTLPTNFLKNLTFAFLALGDSNYTNFCNCGKTIDARLQSLGAKHFYDTGYADDAVGLEIVVEPWIEQLFSALKKHLGKANFSIDDSTVVQPINQSPVKSPENNVNTFEINSKIEEDSTKITVELQTNKHIGVNGFKSRENLLTNGRSLTTQINLTSGMEASLKYSIPPLSTAALKIPRKLDAYLGLRFIEDEESQSILSSSFLQPSAATDVYTVPVSSARQLTNDSMVKKALEIQLDTTIVEFDFQPGDSFGIMCNNKTDEVDYLIHRVGIDDIADKKLALVIKTDTEKKAPVIPQHIQLPSSLRDILLKDVDFRAVPRKAFLRMLVEYTEDVNEKRRLQELCSVQGGKDYTAFIREQNTGLIEILKTFESCKPPIERILEFLPKLLPREYSVASSPMKSKNSVKFVFNVIEFPSFESNERYGLCTKYLDDLTSSMRRNDNKPNSDEITNKLAEMKLEEIPKVNLYFRKPTNFRFPDDPTLPLIMIGPGTGVAPFIGFLEQRECLKEKNVDLVLGHAMLFYGCRYKEKDFLYRSELTQFLDIGILSELHCSYSRDSTAEEIECRTKYVQDNVKKFKADVMDLVIEKNGIVFICGDAKHMGRDVTETFVELIEEYKGLDKKDAIQYLNNLRKTKQFLEDVWT